MNRVLCVIIEGQGLSCTATSHRGQWSSGFILRTVNFIYIHGLGQNTYDRTSRRKTSNPVLLHFRVKTVPREREEKMVNKESL